ncbi:undecaprenyldiphospho-muramoylpentapeptide beta-N-acetylglucosaminyltransferase [Maribrevibacterium harenarium]|uniref:UDP-N-acetylglucosamine--N-acetylmuramyl-(pentapeptide) pyrophosphoryl-undecaprenol N-acetylglucosamine transferase n=1 Tax=Maribrevibacterium harenarium TaxID=2589817 RepID=A0A501X092_9GAMM|nr:undecaprenyldiphospho-muramoylpentapeptide beta-N-acetylglucosaminyltransferase [Maribrevibacterium harenarium]TPE51976.1 undecaprenyldiphospho-muramoylpentapeptide beta-N-acetylglucosaminyltransferase [Maribrevibacterium harenarium]
MAKSRTVVIMAGGTGGHIYPALACAQLLLDKGVKVVWLGSKGGMEERLVPEREIPLRTISIKGVRGKGIAGLVFAPFRILHAIGQAVAHLRNLKPDVVLGMGGFVAGPGGVAAKLLGIPLVIHEQNAVAGTTNKLLSKIASRCLQAFDGALPNAVTVGNPVRREILEQVTRPVRGNNAAPLKLLVVGGSLGAQAINQAVPELLANWRLDQRLDVWHQTGMNNIDAVKALYDKHQVAARVEPYIDNMNQAYYWADVVLCRAGAMTVSELAIAKLPSILVPFPFAIDDHQTKNAEHLEKCGGAILLPQAQMQAERLRDELESLLKDSEQLEKMGQAAGSFAHPNATHDVVAHCIRLMK